ncbi:MAG TPA: sulfurtransferase [Anaerolineaceae bacterium]|nr:sulfurtransferase [Anaerolineaceae bacterium]
MGYETIVSTETLADSLANPGWVIFDCRFDLAKPDWGFADYQTGHIPGAIFADLNRELSGPVNPKTGRHPLPDPAEFNLKCAEWGIMAESQVVVYDLADGSFAGRLWWMLKASGHKRVALLDGGFQKWKSENRPIKVGIDHSSPITKPAPCPGFDTQAWVTSEEVMDLIEKPNFILLDARTPERFWGKNETIDPIAGHIPGAVNRYFGLNLKSDGTFKAPEELRQEFLDLLGQIPPENAVVYCGSGVTSCQALVAMEVAGLKGARLYAGSWSEWIRDPKRLRWIP